MNVLRIFVNGEIINFSETKKFHVFVSLIDLKQKVNALLIYDTYDFVVDKHHPWC